MGGFDPVVPAAVTSRALKGVCPRFAQRPFVDALAAKGWGGAANMT